MTLCQHCSLSFWRTVTLVCHVPLAQPWGCRHLSPYVSWQHCENHSGHGTNILSIWRSTNIFCLFMPKTTRVVESYFLLLHPCSSVRLWFLNRALLHCYCGLYHLLFSSICQQARFNHSTDFLGDNQCICPSVMCLGMYAQLSKADEGGHDKEPFVLFC